MIQGDHPGFLEILSLIQGCDYRELPAGLERGEGCGCNPEVICLQRRGQWADRRDVVDYATCVECVTTWPEAGAMDEVLRG